ncbi:hypothetical protein A2U01_0043337, partial [Trifolium medium]|nr:hypothetical protein [Trifolium medium]
VGSNIGWIRYRRVKSCGYRSSTGSLDRRWLSKSPGNSGTGAGTWCSGAGTSSPL